MIYLALCLRFLLDLLFASDFRTTYEMCCGKALFAAALLSVLLYNDSLAFGVNDASVLW